MNVGFIGLGRMGFAMASNLAAAGHTLFLHDTSPEAVERASTFKGANLAATPRETAEKSDVIFTVLPNDDIVREVYLGAEGIAEGTRNGLVTCDASTVSPEVSTEIQAKLQEKGAMHLDTPMLGSQPQAVDGTIFFIVAGAGEAVAKVTPLLETMGKMHMHVGPSGTANQIKLIHNALGAVNSVAVSESLALCVRCGVDLETFFQVVRNGGGMAYSTFFEKRVQRMIAADFSPTFTLELMLKDVTLARNLANAGEVPVPIMEETLHTYQEAAEAGHKTEDFSAVGRVIEKRIGDKVYGK
jgi:3-hydroxyisobutyrate dehydrogenase